MSVYRGSFASLVIAVLVFCCSSLSLYSDASGDITVLIIDYKKQDQISYALLMIINESKERYKFRSLQVKQKNINTENIDGVAVGLDYLKDDLAIKKYVKKTVTQNVFLNSENSSKDGGAYVLNESGGSFIGKIAYPTLCYNNLKFEISFRVYNYTDEGGSYKIVKNMEILNPIFINDPGFFERKLDFDRVVVLTRVIENPEVKQTAK